MKLLEGVKIVSLETHVAVPAATRQLADWGAEVIKIEGLTGDLWRFISGLYSLPIEDDENCFFAIPNANKKLVSIDVKAEKGKEILFKMLEDADAFVSSVRYQSLEHMGLDWETLHAKFPSLVYYHFSGYGYEGPKADLPGFDSAAFWANSGMLGDFASDGDVPINLSMASGDTATSSNVLAGILGGILHRKLTGEGVRGTTSLYASGIWMDHGNIMAYQKGYKKTPMPSPRVPYELRGLPFNRSYKCKDGLWVCLCVLEHDKGKAKVLPLLGLEHLAETEYFKDLKSVLQHKKESLAIVAEGFMQKTRDEWLKIFAEADLVLAPVMAAADVAYDEQAIANGYIKEYTFPTGNKIMMPQSPNHFFDIEIGDTINAGAIGSDTVEVLKEHGYSDDEIAQLAADKVVRIKK